MLEMNKTLIFNDGVYKTYNFNNNNWETVTPSASESDYLKSGINEISIIPESAWRKLAGTIEFCIYTDNANKKEIQLNMETTSFTLNSDWAGQVINVLEYSDASAQTALKVNIETDEFTLMDEWEGRNITVVEYTDSPIQTESDVTIETEPFTLYEEMGNSMGIMYYTDDASKTNATLEITSNYSPIDELIDPKLYLWTSNEEDEQKNLQYTAVPEAKLIKQIKDHIPAGRLQKMELTAVQQYQGKVRVVVSGDGGDTWKTIQLYSNGTFKVVPIQINDLQIVKKKGFHPSSLSLLGENDWKLISPRGAYRFAYYVEQNYLDDVAQIDKLISNEMAVSSTPKVNSLSILYNDIDKKYSGLMFMDSNRNYYSTSLGEILKYLDFGTLIAGQNSIDIKVKLANTYPFNVNNIKLWSEHNISGLTVQFSKSNSPFIAQSKLTFSELLKFEEEVEFYILLSVDPSAQSGGNFDIRVSADPA